MQTVYSDRHRLHDAKGELYGGVLVPPFEMPRRAELVLARVEAVGLGEVVPPDEFGLEPIRRIHDAGYLSFLETAWDEWVAAGYEGEVLVTVWPSRVLRDTRIPTQIDGRVGYYALAGETPIMAGTWRAARAAVDVALTAQKIVSDGARAAFALCRPPGHHAARDMYGGYCFLNNAAITAQAFRDQGVGKVAILDVDFHHGNGTQDLFYDRGDVFYASLHGHPEDAFPHFLGWEDETGEGAGEGCNANYPVRPGARFDEWGAALDDAYRRIAAFGAEALVISLGVDAYKEDPISFFKLESEDYTTCGARIATLGMPTLFVMEGGYAIEEIGVNTANLLCGFEGAA